MTRSLLTKSMVLAILAGTATGVLPALANDPDLQFYPAAKWDVSSVSGKPDTNCTVSSEFNNGFVIQFSGNEKNFTNMNIDFRQDTFDKGKMYDVKLSVPGVADATIPSKALQKSVMISDLRPYQSLASALLSASVLDFEIEGNTFRFYMTGLAAALKDNRQCAGNTPLETPQKLVFEENEQTSVTPLPVAKSSQRPDERKDDRFTEMLAQNLKDESPKPKPVPPVIKGEKTSLQQKMAELAELDAGNEPAKNSEDILGTAPTNKAAPAVANAPPAPKAPPKVENIKSPPPKITKEPPVKMEADFTKISQDEGKMAVATKNMPPLKEAGEIPPPSVHPVDTEMRNKIRDLEKQVLKLQNENASLESDLKGALDDAREERMSVSSENWNLERATMRFNEAERQIERLGRQLQTAKTQCESEKRELEGMLFDPQVTNQQQLARLAALEADLEQARADLLTQQRTYEERIKLLEERLGGK